MTIAEQCALLRPLCQQLRALAEMSENGQRREDWKRHNALEGGTRPLLWVCPDDDGGWQELIGNQLISEDADLRVMEFSLRKQLYHAEYFPDDFVLEPVLRFDSPGVYTGYHYGFPGPQTAWGIPLGGYQIGGNAYHLTSQFDYRRDWEVFAQTEADFIADVEALARKREKYELAADGAITIQFVLPYVVLVQSLLIELVHMRGLEELMFDLVDEPEAVHQVLDHMSQSKARLLDKLEAEGRLFDNRTNIYTGSGGLGYYPADAQTQGIMLSEMWGFADSQEFGQVSPAMFEEFALQYQVRGLNKFGMACYGCCEPLDDRIDRVFRLIPRLRRVSVSPWSNPDALAEQIGQRAIFSWKPNPALICQGFDVDFMRGELTRIARIAQNSTVEVILKDIRTCGSTPAHMREFALLAKQILT